MTQTLETTFDGEVFKPLTSVQLPKNTKVRLVIDSSDEVMATLFLDVTESLNLQDSSDWSLLLDS